MGAFGYNETIWIVSEECALVRVVTDRKNDICHVCRTKITNRTCFEFDDVHFCENSSFLFPPEKTCWKCARKLVESKEIASR